MKLRCFVDQMFPVVQTWSTAFSFVCMSAAIVLLAISRDFVRVRLDGTSAFELRSEKQLFKK